MSIIVKEKKLCVASTEIECYKLFFKDQEGKLQSLYPSTEIISNGEVKAKGIVSYVDEEGNNVYKYRVGKGLTFAYKDYRQSVTAMEHTRPHGVAIVVCRCVIPVGVKYIEGLHLEPYIINFGGYNDGDTYYINYGAKKMRILDEYEIYHLV